MAYSSYTHMRPLAIATSWKQETSPRKRRSLEFAIYRSHLHDTPQPNVMHPHNSKKEISPEGLFFVIYRPTRYSRIQATWTHPVRPKVIRKVSYIAKTIGVTFGLDFVPKKWITSTPSLLQMATTFPQITSYTPPKRSDWTKRDYPTMLLVRQNKQRYRR